MNRSFSNIRANKAKKATEIALQNIFGKKFKMFPHLEQSIQPILTLKLIEHNPKK